MRWDRYIAIIGRITQRPECHEQAVYHCGTAHCVAGHAQIDSGGIPDDWHCWADAVRWLDIDHEEAGYAFDQDRTLAELQELAITQKFPWERS